ncbi:MAG: DUF3179 domain-containing protein [Bacteroidetes bacterium]|nr:DUF3179 domain-containing protein [Bacteroidota bacterium]
MWRLILILGFLLLLSIEAVFIYLVSPFPGSQEMTDTVEFAHTLFQYRILLRAAGGLMVATALWYYIKPVSRWKLMGLGLMLVVYSTVFYLANYPMAAEYMFKIPENKVLLSVADNQVNLERVVMGLHLSGESVAYPIEIMGYHHQVYDTLGSSPVVITYCIVCRTGRAFSPVVNDKQVNFRLVGMTQYNAMFEDPETKSWWMQATGEAVAGPLKGQQLAEVSIEQMTLGAWIDQYPTTKILQYDSACLPIYERLEGFDRGKLTSNNLKTDSTAWAAKAWIIGIKVGELSRAYDWLYLNEHRLINDQIGETPLLIYLDADGFSFHTWNRNLLSQTLEFELMNDTLRDKATGSAWNAQGVCIKGKFEGKQLLLLQSYQEYWHSWQSFQPKTDKFPL